MDFLKNFIRLSQKEAINNIENYSVNLSGKNELIYSIASDYISIYIDHGIIKKGFFRKEVILSVCLRGEEYFWKMSKRKIEKDEMKQIGENISKALTFLNIKHLID